MKKKIHPQFGPATITCACGNKVKTSSTVKEIRVEICSACHPLYTGKSKMVDTAGRLDKFKTRQEKSAEKRRIKTQKTQKETQKTQNLTQKTQTKDKAVKKQKRTKK